MKNLKAFLVALAILVLANGMINAYGMDLELAGQSRNINNTDAIKGNPINYNGPATYQSFKFGFASWGAYGGYKVGNKQYLQDYGSSKCWPQDHLPTGWVSEVLNNSDGIGTITSQEPLELGEGYTLVIKSIDVKGPKLYLELIKNNNVVNSQIIRLTSDSNENICDAYCYRENIKDSTGAIIQYNFPIIAVHFKNTFMGVNGPIATIDGIWQISETPRLICNSYICSIMALCNSGQCTCPQGQIDCNDKCIPIDNDNCGQCGIACAIGQTCCNGRCIDTSGDTNNCGGCDKICSTCGSCANGVCTTTGDLIFVDQTNPNPANKIYPTIQDAINNANDCSIIDVSEGTYQENLLVMDKSLVIKGSGIDKTIVDGMGLASVFNLEQKAKSSINVTLADMTIQNGTFSGTEYYTAGTGGGINIIGSGCSATVKNCTISRNHGVWGGGINIYGTSAVKVIGCNISSNIAYNNGGGILDGANDVTVIDSRINNNCAIYGGGIEDDGFTLKVQNSIIFDNKYYGIYWEDAAGQPIIENSQIKDNKPDDIYPPIF